MSESSSQDKSEQPTEERLRKSRREGQVARSKELQTAALILMGALLIVMSRLLADFSQDLMSLGFKFDRDGATDPKVMLSRLAAARDLALGRFLPTFLLLWLAGALAGLIPGGLLLAGKGVQPQWKRLNPLSGLKRMFSTQSLVELVKSIVKVVALSGVMAWLLWSHAMEVIMLSRLPLGSAIGKGVGLLATGISAMGSVLLLIALVDVPYQRWSMLNKLKMTRQEVKDEQKNTEGRPEIKRRIREVQMQMSRSRIDQRVPQADVIITNPTHYAVAIRYQPERTDAPYVVAKGVDDLAQRIRQVAERNGKPVLELPELTRAVYHSTRVDQEIPAGLYNAVAHVLMYVLQLSNWKQRGGAKPAPLPPFHIPESLRK